MKAKKKSSMNETPIAIKDEEEEGSMNGGEEEEEVRIEEIP